jgi:hypothetical protein
MFLVECSVSFPPLEESIIVIYLLLDLNPVLLVDLNLVSRPAPSVAAAG